MPLMGKSYRLLVLTFTASILLLLNSTELKSQDFYTPQFASKQASWAGLGSPIVADASVLHYNTGGMGFLQGTNISIGISPLLYSSKYIHTPTGSSGSTENTWQFPYSIFATHQVSKNKDSGFYNLVLGIGVYTPFNLHKQYPTNWDGQFMVQSFRYQSTYIQPTVSYRFGNQIGVGLGFLYQLSSINYTKAIPIPPVNIGDENTQASANYKANGRGVGLVAGVYIEPIPDYFSIGFSYTANSFTDSDLTGNAVFTVPAAAQLLYANTNLDFETTMPEVIRLGFSYYPFGQQKMKMDKLNVVNVAAHSSFIALEFERVAWSNFERWRFSLAENVANTTNFDLTRTYYDRYAIRSAVQFKLNSLLMLKGGVAYQTSAALDGFESAELPDAAAWTYSLGLMFISPYFDIDIGYTYFNALENNISNTADNFTAIYNSHGFMPSLGISYRLQKLNSL